MSDDDDSPSAASAAGVTFRSALRRMFAQALARLSADGVVTIAPDEMPGLLEQVRETADPKFGDYSGTMAMPLAKKSGRKPRDLALEIIARLDVADLFEKPAAPEIGRAHV